MINNNSNAMVALRSARTVKDVTTVISSISKIVDSIEIPDVKAPASNLTVSISAGGNIEAGDIYAKLENKHKSAPAQAKMLNTDVDLASFDTSTLKGRAIAAKNQAILQQCHQELLVAFQVLSSKALGTIAEKSRLQAQSSIRTILDGIADKISEYTRKMAASAGEIPSETIMYSRKLKASIKRVLPAESYSGKIYDPQYYVAKHDSETYTYQSFIRIPNFTNNEGMVYRDYAIVLTTIVNVKDSKASYYVTSITDAMSPGSFPIGSSIDSEGRLLGAVNRLIAIDGAAGSHDRVKIGNKKGTSYLKAKTPFSSKILNIQGHPTQIFDNVRVQNDRLYVRLVKGMSPKEKQQAVEEARSIFSTVFRDTVGANKKNDVVYSIKRGSSGREFLELYMIPSKGTRKGMMTVNKIREMATALGLTNEQISALKQAIK